MENGEGNVTFKYELRTRLTVFMRVDSELATKTKTSASKQNLSIQLSSSVVTSVPGLLGGGNKNNKFGSKIMEFVTIHLLVYYRNSVQNICEQKYPESQEELLQFLCNILYHQFGFRKTSFHHKDYRSTIVGLGPKSLCNKTLERF